MNWSPYRNEPQKQESPSLLPAIVFFGLLFLGFVFFVNFGGKDQNPYPDDDIVIVDPDDNRQTVSLNDTYVVRVYETEADQQKAWLVKLLDSDAFWIDWMKEKGMTFFTFDPTSNPEQSESFLEAANKKGILPPFFIHAAKGGKVLSVNAFTETVTVDSIKKTLLSKAK